PPGVAKLPVDVEAMNIDLLSMSAHKMYGSKGIGALYVRAKGPRVRLTPIIDGGGHERGFRSGTLNVPGIVGFGKACEICREGMADEAQRLLGLRERLRGGLFSPLDDMANEGIDLKSVGWQRDEQSDCMAYSDKVIDHYSNPPNVGSFPKDEANVGTGVVGAPECGDVMKLQLKINDDGIVEDARFKTFGCGSAIASSSYVTELVKGKTVDEVLQIKNTHIVQELSLPPVKIHCSVL